MPSNAESRLKLARVPALGAIAILLFAAAVGVRGIPPERVVRPEDVVDEHERRLVEPMQFLARGAGHRVEELDLFVVSARREAFKTARAIVFSIPDCPPLMEWIDAPDGQRVERLLRELRGGSREEALASLALVFQLARATEWETGVLARSQHAERLGGLLQDWLRVWGEKSAKDPLLVEPALAATLAYGRVMREAWDAPVVGHNDAPYERAIAFLTELTAARSPQRTSFGEALQARHPRAFQGLAAEKDALQGLADEARILFPDLAGDCR